MSGAEAEKIVIYDPTNPETMANPFPIYTQLRRDDPVHWSPSLKSWVVTRYLDVRSVLTDSMMTVDRLSPFYEALPSREAEVLKDIVHYLNLWLAFQDPPSHTRLRRMLRGPFAGASIEGMRPAIEDIVQHVLDGLEGRQDIDVIAEFALLVPAYVIMDMLDVPRDRLADFKTWADDMATFIGGSRNIDDKYERAARGCQSMSSYFRTIIETRRANPKPGFLMDLIEAGEDGQKLSDDELVATCMLILFAGHETTTNLLGTSICGLLQHPDQLKLFMENPDLNHSAVEEFLRYDGPTNALVRNVAQDHELHGKMLKKGQRVFLMINSANRDPDMFDEPEKFDITRKPNRHMTFGQGIHTCLGSQLAREEGRVAVRAFFERFPNAGFVTDKPSEYIDAMVPRGLKHLHLHLDTTRS